MKGRKEKRVWRLIAADAPSIHPVHVSEVDLAAVSGAVAGAAVGSVAGPPGMIAGTILGAAAGMAAGGALEKDDWRHHLIDERLDREIGVTEGNIGAARPDQPLARIGAFSAGSSGASYSHGASSEGPMQTLDDED